MPTDIQLAWLAGLLDGEGCIAFAKRTDYVSGRGRMLMRYDVKLAMACEMTVRICFDLVADIIGDDLVKVFKEKRRNERVRPLWRCEISSKRGVYDLLTAVEPHLVTKRLEAQLCLRFLERSMCSKHYHADEFDVRLAEVATALRHGCGEARAEACELLGQVIPSQAVLGPESPYSGSRTEGVEATTVTPKENPSQECPAPHLHERAEGEEMVRSRGEILGGGFNGHRLRDN